MALLRSFVVVACFLETTAQPSESELNLAFFQAASAGNVDDMGRLLEEGADIDGDQSKTSVSLSSICHDPRLTTCGVASGGATLSAGQCACHHADRARG
jgi:hypothetical protein